RQSVEQQPGVVGAAYADGVPLGVEPSWWEDLKVKGYVPTPGENMKIYRNVISPGYFDLLHIPIVEGRDFTEQDGEDLEHKTAFISGRPVSTPVMIVNQAFVRRFIGEGNPLGRQVYGWGAWFTVVGEVQDSKYKLLTQLQY